MSAITDLITQYAGAAGVPAEVALAVAQQESGTQQWRSNGSLVTGSSGEVGVFQLMPATAAQLGVDPTDLNQNIQGGVSYLQQLYAQFNNWPAAIAAYNAGPGRVASGNIPSSTQSYVSSVLSLITGLGGSISSPAAASDNSVVDFSGLGIDPSLQSAVPVGTLAIGAIGLLLLWWLLD